jgi:hypothetical protein
MFGLETARDKLAAIVAEMMREAADLPREENFHAMLVGMTKQDERTALVYTFIQQYIQREGHPPTIKEIADSLNYTNWRVLLCVDVLEVQGLIARPTGVPRGIKLIGDASFRPAPRRRR